MTDKFHGESAEYWWNRYVQAIAERDALIARQQRNMQSVAFGQGSLSSGAQNAWPAASFGGLQNAGMAGPVGWWPFSS